MAGNRVDISPDEQAKRVDEGLGWLLCDYCDEPAVVHKLDTDTHLCAWHATCEHPEGD